MEETALQGTPGREARPEIHETSPHNGNGRTIGGLFSELFRETAELVHEEAELAKAEMSEKMTQVGTGVGAIAAGGAILFAGLIVALFAGVGALEQVLPADLAPWLSPLIVGLATMIIGAIALAIGRSELKSRNLAPKRTLQTLRGHRDLVKEHLQ